MKSIFKGFPELKEEISKNREKVKQLGRLTLSDKSGVPIYEFEIKDKWTHYVDDNLDVEHRRMFANDNIIVIQAKINRGAVEMHNHKKDKLEYEAVIVIEGSCSITVNNQKIDLPIGYPFLLDATKEHAIEAAEPSDVLFFWIKKQ